MRHVRKRACDVRHAWARHGGYGLARVLVRAGLGVGVARFLRGDFRRVSRAGSIRPIKLPGGDRAVKEIGRIGLSLLWDAGCCKEEV